MAESKILTKALFWEDGKFKCYINLKIMDRKNNYKKNIAYKNAAYIIQPNVRIMYFRIFIISPFGYRVHHAGEFINFLTKFLF